MSCAVCQALQETKYNGSNTSESSFVDKNIIQYRLLDFESASLTVITWLPYGADCSLAFVHVEKRRQRDSLNTRRTSIAHEMTLQEFLKFDNDYARLP
ncbi:hypothetical protein T03_10495 [Trichinella britovi]|uniref:Uncharacterized protein n=1 Tax=Trichinella britovi TaxID=45882 RepID=A0A0V1CUW7_TRIBR|nr:hypothetical protein T03_10495 [Trichinella britovi]